MASRSHGTGYTVVLTGFPRGTTRENVNAWCLLVAEDMDSPYDCKMHGDASKGTAYLLFRDEDSALMAQQHLDKKLLDAHDDGGPTITAGIQVHAQVHAQQHTSPGGGQEEKKMGVDVDALTVIIENATERKSEDEVRNALEQVLPFEVFYSISIFHGTSK